MNEIHREEDYEPLGFNYITLRLADVLLDPVTIDLFTPNTSQTKNLKTGEVRVRGDGWIKDEHSKSAGDRLWWWQGPYISHDKTI